MISKPTVTVSALGEFALRNSPRQAVEVMVHTFQWCPVLKVNLPWLYGPARRGGQGHDRKTTLKAGENGI